MPRFAPNVSALQRVLPDDLSPEEIDARPGATWIESTDVSAFVREALGASQVATEHIEVMATWTIAVPTWQKQSLAMTSTWGTDRLDAVSLLTKSLNQTSAVVYDSDGDGGRVFNPEATLLGQGEATGTLRPLRRLDLGGPQIAPSGWPPVTTNCSTPSSCPPGTALTNPSPACRRPSFRTATSSTPPGARSKNRPCCSAMRSVPARPPPW